MTHTMTKEIGIDAGHRIPDHASKCKNIHGHRYDILATCEAEELHKEGEQKGMILDFSFMKEVMMRHIDTPCDHGLILFEGDPILSSIITDPKEEAMYRGRAANGFCCINHPVWGKIYLMDAVPTAENLAEHWYERMRFDVAELSSGLARLSCVEVYETPNCSATYSPSTEQVSR